jgi:hypothetical protein
VCYILSDLLLLLDVITLRTECHLPYYEVFFRWLNEQLEHLGQSEKIRYEDEEKI